MYRGFGDDQRIKGDAIIGFAIGVLASYLLQCRLGFGGCSTGFLSAGGILQILIITGAGWGWYHIRNVL